MDNSVIRNPKVLVPSKTALLIIDMQERILAAMNSPEEILSNTIKLVQGFRVLRLPVYYTEQYPKGLGSTVKELKSELEGLTAIEKMSFSCSGAGELFGTLKLSNIMQVVVCGIESHVCVQQTVLDLLSNGFQVDVAADAVSSRREKDYKIALKRMNSNGAEVTTTESILFELLKVCGTEEFKKISRIVK
ncbi:MAG: hydrolase [Ignavibacteria bacterium]|jgi:nicotinamidase-related amidase|nr:hydrolase [Ignavibacteria bacterium]MCU7502781.1 hydrolase [Ignavibacteria bacterium]MCU7518379.1 hydrolase [Ignavibacteria bacterium]